MMNSAQKLSDARMQPSSTTVSNAAFIILLSVILHIEDESKLRKSRNQLCTLYLSESLTVINSNKRYLTNTMPIASNRQSSGLIELVITETCAAFHILAHLAHCGKRSVSAIAPDNDCILKEFAMAKANRTSAASKVLNSTPLILSCCRLISNLLKLNHIPNDPHFEEAACLLLDVMEEDTLFPGIELSVLCVFVCVCV